MSLFIFFCVYQKKNVHSQNVNGYDEDKKTSLEKNAIISFVIYCTIGNRKWRMKFQFEPTEITYIP